MQFTRDLEEPPPSPALPPSRGKGEEVGSFRGIALLLAALIATLAPFAVRAPAAPGADRFPGWLQTYEGRTLTPMPLSAREDAFAKGFPGRVGRFTDGRREIILRWVAMPTRQLHPSADCFRAIGYRISTRPMRLASDGQPMSCFRADGPRDAFDVCERVTSASGGSWSDVSAWYWHALWNGRGESWWSVVVAERASAPEKSERP